MVTLADGWQYLARLVSRRSWLAPALRAKIGQRPPAERSGEERANRFMVILLGLQRLSYVIPPLVAIGSTSYRSPAVNTTLVAVTLAWNVVLFGYARRRGWFMPAMVWLDVGLAAALLLAVAANLPASQVENGSLNWSQRMAQAAAALAGAALHPIPLAAAGVSVILAAHAVVTVATHPGPGLAGELATCLNSLVWFAVIIGFGLRYLRRQGRLVDRLNAERLAAESRSAAEHARHLARVGCFRALHDTVLATLVMIARGGLDPRTEQVRQRCARDAEFVRRLMLDDASDQPAVAADKLIEVMSAAEALGLRIHYHRDALPADLPAEVVDAVGEATREALNNVARHAGVDVCWVTAMWEDGVLTVRVVDRGSGFDPRRQPAGFGLSHSIDERMRSAGGVARVSSSPGGGTTVELEWRR